MPKKYHHFNPTREATNSAFRDDSLFQQLHESNTVVDNRHTVPGDPRMFTPCDKECTAFKVSNWLKGRHGITTRSSNEGKCRNLNNDSVVAGGPCLVEGGPFLPNSAGGDRRRV